MEPETDIPKFKIPGFRLPTNPLTKEGVRALAIVLGVIVLIAGVVYAANFGKRKESMVLPATTEKEATATPELAVPTEIPTITPLTKEATSSASPSSTGRLRKPTGTPTPTVEEVTVTPTPAI